MSGGADPKVRRLFDEIRRRLVETGTHNRHNLRVDKVRPFSLT